MATSDRLKKARGNSRRKRRHCFRQSTLGGVAISSGGLASHSAPKPRTNTTAYPAALSWWQADNTQPAQLQTAQRTIQQASEAGALGWDGGMERRAVARQDFKRSRPADDGPLSPLGEPRFQAGSSWQVLPYRLMMPAAAPNGKRAQESATVDR